MKVEQKSKATPKMNKCGRRCLKSFGLVVVLALIIHYGQVRFLNPELRLVMETYYFGNGLANLTGDTSVLENVVTERVLLRKIDYCNKGLCDGRYPPHVIGRYFNVLRETNEFAIVELEERPIIADLDRKPGRYIRRCFSLERDGDAWRVSGMYLDCDGYLPDRYK